MLDNGAFFQKDKRSGPFFGALLILLDFLSFSLDILTKDLIAFAVFYFQYIMLAAWYFGNRIGYRMAGVTGVLWFIAQENTGSWGSVHSCIGDGLIHLITLDRGTLWRPHFFRVRSGLFSVLEYNPSSIM